MAKFNLTLTSSGANLLAKGIAGSQLDFKYIVLGDGSFSGSTVNAAALVHEVLRLPLSKMSRNENEVSLRARIPTGSIDESFVWSELGVIATDPDTNADVLYTYGYTTNTDFMPSDDDQTKLESTINITVIVASAPNVTATVDPSLEALTNEDLENHNKDAGSHADILSKKADLDENGKVPESQLPDLNFDPAGSAAAVQQNLNAHTANRQNPHGVTAVQVGAYTKEETNNLINTHINNKQNPHGVTAVQVGAYDKNQSLTSATAQLFGLPAGAVPNDVLAKIKTLLDSVSNNASAKASIITGSYIGDGFDSRTINLGATPKFFTGYLNRTISSSILVFPFYCGQTIGDFFNFSVYNNSIKISVIDPNNITYFNYQGWTYYYVAII